MGFDGNGNISQKSDLEAFTLNYSGVRADGSSIGPHALATISGVPVSPFPQNDLTVTYTDFKKISTLDEGAKHYELTYGVDDERRMSVYYENGKLQGAPTLTRYYLGDYEEEIGANGKVRKIHYLSGALLIQNEGIADSLYYTYTDNQGSLIALTDVNGNIIRKYAYDPWGSRRNPTDWTVKDAVDKLVLNRGYTGHEHLDAFSIINMNGRVYDPLTAQFFSPDPFIQSPGDWLNYNRYGYCLNNPLKYTDPTGEVFGIDDVLFAMGYAALTEGIRGGMAADATGGNVVVGGLGGAIQGAGTSFFTTLVPYGVGQAFGHELGSPVNELLRMGAHGATNGLMDYMQGGNFWQGFAEGAVSSLAGSALQVAGADDLLLPFGTGLAGAGTAALIGGDPMAGFNVGYGIGAENFKGEKLKGDDGNTYIASIDDATVIGNRFMHIPNPINLPDGRKIKVSFNYTSSDGKNGNQPVRTPLYLTLRDGLMKTTEINSIDISATTNGSHQDWRHPAGKAMDIDNFNGTQVRNMQNSQMIINFQKALETNPYWYQDFGPKYHFYPGHQTHVHFSINL